MGRGSRSTPRIAYTAKPATSKIPRRTSTGSRRKAAAAPTTRICEMRNPLSDHLRASFAVMAVAASLAACSSMSETGAGKDTAGNNPYGTYLSARFAASEHDLSNAASLYRESLTLDPKNAELLDKAFLYTAISGNLDGAVALAHRMIADNADNRAARLALAVDAFKKGNYGDARSEIEKSAKGPFTALTLSLLNAWALQGQGDTDGALAELKKIPSEGGTET